MKYIFLILVVILHYNIFIVRCQDDDDCKDDPAKPDPAKPDPAKPDPAQPDPAKPDPGAGPADDLCNDKHPKCKDHGHVCGINTYRIMMVRTCATTCNFCQEAQAMAANCRDANPNCAPRKNICYHPTYKQMMSKACAQTCSYC